MTSPNANLPIAVVGMACRLPGARNVDQFWQMLLEGGSAIGPVPEERFDRKLYYNPQRGVPGASYADKAALIDYAPDTAPDDFLSQDEIEIHDAAHIVLCRVTREAFANAGLSLPAVQGRKAGVYLGHATGSGLSSQYSYGMHIAQTANMLHQTEGFERLAPSVRDAVVKEVVNQVRQQTPQRTPDCNPSLHASAAAKLVAEKFQLDGPQMVFNSACASSLQALAHGMKALSLGRIDMAVVGGASCFHSDTLVLFSQAQSLSTTGSFPFTEGADGLIVGEGAIIFLLKRLEAAEADNDRILAVLPNIGISSDGSGKSLWAPRSEGQVAAIRRAYPDAQAIQGLQYIEAHATSTNLGDKTEIGAISEVLREHLPPNTSIPIGGVKRNIGHTLEVAGAAGLLKVILAMQHGVIPPAVDALRPLTKKVDWPNLPLFVNNQPLKWTEPSDTGIRRAGVNAFGIGGLNVHLVVESHNAAAPKTVRPVRSPRASTRDDRSIAIVGMGVVLPGAKNLSSFAELLRSGRSVIGDFPSDKWEVELFANQESTYSVPLPGAGTTRDFQYDWRKHRIPPKQLAQANPLQFMMLDAVDQAFEQSGLREHSQFDPKKTGCIVGTQFGGDFSTQLNMDLRLPESRQTVLGLLRSHGVGPQEANQIVEKWCANVLERFPALVDESGSFTASALASRITKSFDLMGGGIAVDASDQGAFAALSNSIDMLLSEACDTMVCVAGEHSLLPENFQIATFRGLLASSAESGCPFDARANGTVPGEGCVALVLRRLDDARRDGNKVLGLIEGVGAARQESRAATIAQAVQRALEEASLAPSEVSGVESIGLGVEALDAEEALQLAQVYERTGESSAPLICSTPVWQVGHLGSASGFVSLAAALIGLEDESLPPARPNLQSVESINRTQFFVSSQPEALKTSDPQGRLYVGLNGSTDSETSYHVILQRGETVKPQPAQRTPSNAHQWETESLANGVTLFDATIRRRTKMREASAAASKVPSRLTNPPVATPPPTPAPLAPVAQAPPMPKPVAPAPPVQPPTPTPATPVTELQADEVETFLINFVMEQTGYPREIVELDADLESDLGIDSIKKAQLFGELGEYFDVQASSELSLDDFPTLSTVRDYLLNNSAGEPVAITPEAPSVSPPPALPTQPIQPTQSAPPVASNDLQSDEVETFLINFVMEQTGYPREIVELDADLESDLGIDSIKKAQLFGELGEYFDVQASSDLSLDDFPTLRTVRDYLLNNSAGEPAVETPAVTAVPENLPPAQPETSSALQTDEVETFLINFVMEQTGYPREIVELDADLESDLGIDSIKKAQLFGELGEYFDVQASSDLSLDDFPTLRTVRDYLLNNSGSESATSSTDDSSQVAGPPVTEDQDVETYVIELVMKQTGYPRSVVDLDGDFEIDLGIDDLKVAEILAQLSGHFGVPTLQNARVATPRAIVDHLAGNLSNGRVTT